MDKRKRKRGREYVRRCGRSAVVKTRQEEVGDGEKGGDEERREEERGKGWGLDLVPSFGRVFMQSGTQRIPCIRA